MRLTVVLLPALLPALFAASAFAKLPPPSDDAKAKAGEAKAKSAWNDKSEAYKLCRAQDRVAAIYRKTAAGAGKPAPAPITTPPCTDPGPFTATAQVQQKPLEASEAHSPAATASSPPSTSVPHGEQGSQVPKK